MMMKTTLMLSRITTSTKRGIAHSLTTTTLACIVTIIETHCKMQRKSNTTSGLENGPLQLTSALYGSEVSTTTTLHMPSSVTGLIVQNLTFPKTCLQISTAQLQCLDLMAQTLCQLSRMASAQEIQPISEKLM